MRVEECANTVGATTVDLSGVVCSGPSSGTGPDTTHYTYEPTGEISTIFDALAAAGGAFTSPDRQLRYEYDSLGRPLRIHDPDLTGPGYTETAYDLAGNVVSTTNARLQTRTYTYDVLDRPLQIAAPQNEDSYTFQYRSSELGLWLETSPVFTREIDYDGYGRLERTTVTLNGG